MAAALASLSNVQSQTVSILNANPGVWSPNVATNPVVGSYPSNDEITLAILQGDEQVCVEGYFQSANDALSNPFNVTSVPLADRDNIPFHHGTINKVEVAQSATLFTCTVANILNATVQLMTGQLVSLITTGTLPTGLAVLTNYYVIIATPGATIKLATSYANAIAGTNVSVTQNTGSGTHTVIAWQIGVEAKNIDDITNATQVGNAYVGAGAFGFLFKEDSGVIYTPAPYARVTYPEYVRTSSLQSRQAEENLVTCGAVRKLMKNATPAPIPYYQDESIRGLAQLVQDGVYTTMASKQMGGEA